MDRPGAVGKRPSYIVQQMSVARAHRFSTLGETHETSPPSISAIGSEYLRTHGALSLCES
jgi:hypothetical protein